MSLKLDSEESNILSGSFVISRGNQSNEVISKMLLTDILKLWEESETQSRPRLSAVIPPENIYLEVCCIILNSVISNNLSGKFLHFMFPYSILQTVDSNSSIIINKYPLYVMNNHLQ